MANFFFLLGKGSRGPYAPAKSRPEITVAGNKSSLQVTELYSVPVVNKTMHKRPIHPILINIRFIKISLLSKGTFVLTSNSISQERSFVKKKK